MAVLIKDPEADRLIRELAELTGETITVAVKRSVAERLSRIPSADEDVAQRKRRLREITDYFDALPRRNDAITDDEAVGYGEGGGFI